MARIAVLSIPMYSHVEANTRLARALVNQGHDVIAWAPEAHRHSVESAGAGFRRQETPLAPVRTTVEFAAILAEAAESCTGELAGEMFDHDVELVVHDRMAPWGRIAGDILGLPRIATHPGFPEFDKSSTGQDAPSRAKRDDAPSTADGHAQGAGPESREVLDRLAATRLAIARKWRVEMGSWTDVMFSPAPATVVLTTEEIAGQEPPPGWYFVGPLMSEPPAGRPASPRPLVYVCMGTIFNRRSDAFMAAIDALADEPVDVLVSTGKRGIDELGLGRLASNVEIREFVDARAVLARARVHITHAGPNSVHESLLAGVPMVCMPQGVDQFATARRIEELGAGVVAEEDPEAIRAAVRRLLSDDSARTRAHELGRRLASYDGERRLASLVDTQLADAAAVPD